MNCPVCRHPKSKVKTTIPYCEKDRPKVLRERICEKCRHQFTTIEQPAEQAGK